MKAKSLAVGLACLMGAFCATVPQEKRMLQSTELSVEADIIVEEAVAYDDITPAELWTGSEEALAEMKVREYATNSAARRMLAVVPKTIASYEFADYTRREDGKQDEIIRRKEVTTVTFYLLLMIDESKRGSVLTAKVAADKRAAVRGKAVLTNFLKLLNKNLKK